jgi:hypothetical protein
MLPGQTGHQISPIAAFTELRRQSPEEKGDDQDRYDKGRVRADLQCNEHRLHSNTPVRLSDAKIVSAGEGHVPYSIPACRLVVVRL